jgi:hypothetical protein
MASFALDADSFQLPIPNDTGSTEMRRAASAIQIISRLVSNSIRSRDDGIETNFLPPAVEAGLLDALEFVARGLTHEAGMADDNAQAMRSHR